MDQEAVAIIGAAFTLPGAGDFDTLHENLREGRVSVGAPTADRVRYAGGDPDTGYAPSGYLDRVDLFDHRFFGLSRREAELMDPHQRLTLHLVHQAVENACYAPGSLKGTATAVVFSAPDPAYATLFRDDDPQQILGTLPSAVAARVAYLLDLSGPVLAVDTACSGSLAALALAVNQLRAHTAELAIAGGVSVQSLPQPSATHEPLPGVESPDGMCRPFDAAANGGVGGEGGGFVVLKRLTDALADDDHIHAVLRGIAVNHNGYRATSMSAPSQDAQAELITAAWQDAGLPLTTAGYLEGHGSATPLGDLAEVSGVRQALLAAGVPEHPEAPFPIGSVKGNVGHLDHAAGMAGLFKVLAGLRHTTLYPTARFRDAHALVDSGGPIRVSARTLPWTPAGDGLPRRAGLSSFGLTGTNVHAVIEEPPARRGTDPATGPATTELVTVSAASRTALARRVRGLSDFLDGTDHDLATVAHALNRGRDDHRWRWACATDDIGRLATALRTATLPEREAPANPPVVLLFSGDGDGGGDSDSGVGVPDRAYWRALRTEFPVLADAEDSFGARTPGGPGGGAVTPLTHHYALYRLAESLGLDTGRLVGSGPGNLAVQVARGRLPAARALAAAAEATLTDEVDEAGLRKAVKDFVRDGALLVELGREGTLSRRIGKLAPELTIVPLIGDAGRDDVLGALAHLYEAGADLDWNRHYDGRRILRAEVPTYPFEPVSCWYGSRRADAPPPRPAAAPAPAPPAPEADEAEIRQAVAAIWSDILGAPGIDATSDYFELGGTSIAGITLLRQVEARFGVRLTFADLYEHRTVQETAALIAGRRRGGSPGADWTIVPVPSGDRVPLTYNQEQLWYLDKLSPPGPLYNIPGDLRYTGPLDHDALRAALRDVVRRHDVLRTRIPHEDGRPYVRFDASGPGLIIDDLSHLPEPEREAEARRIAHAEARHPFDLATGPLMRTTLLKLAEDDHLLLCTWHHIVFDGWSPAVFFRDLGECYAARLANRPAQLPQLAVGYGDFARWQRSWLDGERMERGLRYWRGQLAGLEATELPLDRPRPSVESHDGDLLEFTLGPERAHALREFSKHEGVTTFVTLLAVVDALLHLWAGQEDVVVGAAASGRYHPDTHELIGYFNNLLPFRTRVDGGMTFRELVRRCAETVAGALDHEEIPFGKIVSALGPERDASRHPLFTVGYTHQNTASHSEAPDGLTVAPGGGSFGGIAPGTAKLDLTLGVNDEIDGPMTGYLEYAVDLFDRATMERLAGLFQDLVGAAMDGPDRTLPELLDAPHRGPGTAVLSGPERPLGEACPVHRAVAHWAATAPDRPAVVDPATGRTHTYRELNALADRLARRLAAAGVTTGATVPVIAARGVELVTGWLGVLKAGGAFVPVDPALPAERVADLLAGLECPLIVAGEGQEPPLADTPLLRIEVRPPDGQADHPGHPGHPDTAPGDLAYIAYTSGSTGRPHGCEITHRALLNVATWWGAEAGLGPGDRVAQVFAPGFDGAILETLSALSHGAALHVLHDTMRTPVELLRWMAHQRITVTFLPTPLAEVVLREYPDVPGVRLRVVGVGGDRLRVRPPAGAPFRTLNLYGPTECAVVSTWAEVTPGPDAGLPAIGRPIDNATARVLRPDGQPCAVGEQGELYVGGAAVGRGYHRLPDHTTARFLPDPFAAGPGARMYRTGDLARLAADGSLAFLGRADQQVEIRGHRVEPAEIERVLLGHPAVREAVVLPDGRAADATQLVAHLAGDRLPAPDALTAWAAERLPGYMVPARIATYARLPRTANGKTDRKRMVEMTTSVNAPEPATGAAAPAGDGDAERILGRIWADLLGRDSVGPDDNFFEIGGDSILSVAVAARAETAGLSLTPHDVLRRPTLRALAAGTAPAPPGGTRTAPEPPADAAIPLTPLMHSLLEHADDGARDFVVAEVLETSAGIRADLVRRAVARLLELHEPLRFRLRHNAISRWIERADAAPPDVMDVKVLPAMGENAELAVLEGDKDALIKDVDPARGAMLRARFYDRGPDRTGLLLLVVHHFAYDHISLVPLLEDVNSALGTPGEIPPPDSGGRDGWSAWSRHLTAMATGDELAGEATYWTVVMEAGRTAGGLPEDAEQPPRPGAGQGVWRRVIPADRVATALREGNSAGREAAMAAVACAWSRWRGRPDAYLMAVGEGTPNAYRPTGRSRSIGWFTNAFPVLLPVAEGQRSAEALPAVAEQLRAVPHDGVGYGILRKLSPRSPATDRICSLPEPPVLVEHTATGGEALKIGAGPAWIRSVPLVVEQRSLLAHVPVAVSSMVQDGELVIYLVHDGRLRGDRMEEFADHLADAFTELAAGED
ncbi:non-ribosomal peptide synthetase [Streptomyces sp. NBRC 110028]|uniref:non-ribosomal peptide synthetase n=1 Tax=Streptomyces sp. NBRC 110028 TaxID=1621260 RepID=UPI0006E1972D|nr:non-ribosomal peptide synthetase [Streptomyces sp. NBRC 110028]